MFLIPGLPAVPRRSPFGPRFVPSGLAIASDGWATGRGGQVRSRDTTSGSHAVASSRIPRLRSRRVLGGATPPISGQRRSPNGQSPRPKWSRAGCRVLGEGAASPFPPARSGGV